MHELSGFEQRLAVALEVHAGARRPVDAAAIARRAVGPRPVRRRGTESRTLLRFALVAVLVGAVFAGGLLVGAWLQQTPVPPSPSPSRPVTSAEPSTAADVMASTFSCEEAHAAASRTATTWTADAPPAPETQAENGWIAVWGGGAVPELFLIDPTTGEPCSLARFETYTNTSTVATPEEPLGWTPPRGPLVWSPDGQALAFVVVGGDGAERDLYVWSLAGLAGPLITRHDNKWSGTPSWSPDGSLLAAPDIGTTGVGATDVWIVDRTGAPPRSIASGCTCHLGQVQWSASGRSIAATTRGGLTVDDGIVAGSVDGDRLQAVPILAEPVRSGFTEQVFGFVDDQTLLLANPSPRRLTGHRIDGGADHDLGPTRVTNVMTDNGPLSLAPDRSAWLFSPWPSPGFGILEISDAATRTVEAGSADIYGWAPNSRAVGYVHEIQGADQGVWVVGRDGTGARRVAAGPYVLEAPVAGAFAWQPVWPTR
jgi:hypothetical protein